MSFGRTLDPETQARIDAHRAAQKRNVVFANLGGAVGVILILSLLVIGSVAGCGVFKNWQRGQQRANAHNRVAITKINIANEHAQAQVVAADNGVVRQQAYQRYLQAIGIRHAQDEIAKTLTSLYVQHEAIQAEEAIAKSGQNNTVVYVPSGQNGVPVVTANASTGK